MLETLTLDSFAPHVGETFRVGHAAAEGVFGPELRLVEVAPWGCVQGGRQPFSLVFHGPLHPVLAQRVQPLQHAGLGELDIFLVPIGPEGDVMRYQAVFS